LTESIKTSIVTGGTRGIGSVIADVLCDRGDHVITVSRRKLSDENHISADLSSKKQISQISKRIGIKRISNLIFCHRYRGDSWGKEFLISLDAVHHIIESLKTNFASESSIVIISSNASHFILAEQSLAYHATRAALENLMRYYAVHLGGQGTRCNCVLPTSVIKPENKEFFTSDNAVTHLIKDITPLKRMGEASDVAYLVEFLCSDKASFITGQNIFVDGGVSVVGHESIARRLKGLPHSSQKTKD
jgi:NAD(P)-dependent dehydrogenase (short-subunit alcohol dehydrogenase family)